MDYLRRNRLNKRYARIQLPDGKLRELADLTSTTCFGTAGKDVKDLLVQVYKYFLGQLQIPMDATSSELIQ